MTRSWISGALAIGLAAALMAACSAAPPTPPPASATVPAPTATPPAPTLAANAPTPLPTRALFGAGERLPYIVQTGDYVTALAAHFNTTAEEILAANPGLSPTSTLPVGLALQIPSYYFPLGGSSFKIIPDSEFVYGPAQQSFALRAYLAQQPGFLKSLTAFVNQKQRDAAGTLEYVARQYSLNPKLLIALMEWRSGALTDPGASAEARAAPFGVIPDQSAKDWYLQLLWVAEQLSEGYYGWRTGTLTTLPLPGAYRVRLDSYQNAGTVALHALIAHLVPREAFEAATGPEGFAATYRALWGDAWADPGEVLTGGLVQPALALPFEPQRVWTYTGGPHPAWGRKVPWAAVDFAPAGVSGCQNSAEFVRASAAGVVARSGDSTVVLDLDGDGYEGTGWVLFYFHLSERDLIPAGTIVAVGDPLGHPSCEGGTATGTHVHVARRYNGEWLLADGIIPFDLGGWTAQSGGQAYVGRLIRLGAWVEASTASTAQNRIYWVP